VDGLPRYRVRLMLMIVLGAGASYDSVDPNVYDLDNKGWKPPLADGLFTPNKQFASRARAINHAPEAVHQLRRAVANGEDVEAAMDVLQTEAADGHEVRLKELLGGWCLSRRRLS